MFLFYKKKLLQPGCYCCFWFFYILFIYIFVSFVSAAKFNLSPHFYIILPSSYSLRQSESFSNPQQRFVLLLIVHISYRFFIKFYIKVKFEVLFVLDFRRVSNFIQNTLQTKCLTIWENALLAFSRVFYFAIRQLRRSFDAFKLFTLFLLIFLLDLDFLKFFKT